MTINAEPHAKERTMRIPGSRIYRAFPELDRFSDAQCKRFLKAARRDWWAARLARIAAVAAVFLVVAGIGYAVALKVVYTVAAGKASTVLTDAGATAIVLCAVTPLVAALMAALLGRDVVVRRRLRTVINERGRCVGCGYSLLGAPVVDGLTVRCPECGAPTEVDSSLAELQEERGGTVFRPKAHISLTLTPKEKRRRRRTAVALLVGLVAVLLTPLGIWGLAEWNIRRNAAIAAAERPGAAAVYALAATLPATGDPTVNAWQEFANARAIVLKVEAAMQASGRAGVDSEGRSLRPAYGEIGQPIADGREEARAEQARQVALAELTIPELRKAGAFASLVKMRSGTITPPFTIAPSQQVVNVLLPELSYCRQMARINTDRATLARRAGDVAEFEDALLSSLMIARMADQEPFLIAQLVGVAITARVHDQVCAVLVGKPDRAWLDAVDRVLARPLADTPPGYHVEGERLMCLDAAANYFQDPAVVRRDFFRGLTAWARDERPGRVGTYTEARDSFNRLFDFARAEVVKERHQRNPRLALGSGSDQMIVLQFTPPLEQACGSRDMLEVDRRGFRIVAAIERYRLENGRYPAQLSDLTPGQLKSLPTDPYSGKEFLYKPVDAGKDPLGRSYLLYIRGRDGKDDGGKESRFYLDPITSNAFPGFDYIVNSSRR
jgi:hypothetical protein